MEQSTAAFDGPNGSTIITERNKRALDVLKKQFDDGKKRVAIFYGAAHLPDFDRKLTSDLHFTRGTERWIEAWNLRSAAPAKRADKDKAK
jgi:hypothetical protein